MMSQATPAARQIRTLMKRFRKEEDGSVIVLTLFLLILMLILGGMAVDFMRFESRRASLQGCIDNAVLAGADLDQSGTNAEIEAIVEDWAEANGCRDDLDGAPVVTGDGVDYREVTANGELTLDTFFLRLIGTDEMTAVAASTAVEGVGNIEVSLILDMSGSMREEIPGSGGVTRMARLQEAATAFVDALLVPENADKISINLIPYSEHVNAGPDLMAQFNVDQQHGFSHCVEFPDSAYTSLSIDDSAALDQAQHVQFNTAIDVDFDGQADDYYDYWNDPWQAVSELNQPVCPQQTYERIIPMTQDANVLNTAIGQFAPRSGTSIFIGLKWGLALLDPAHNDELLALPASMRDPAFAGRPAAYNANNAAQGATIKYVVLMSDGQNDNSSRLYDWAYDTPSERAHWAEETFPWYRSTDLDWESSNNWRYQKYSYTQGDTLMAQMCTEAKKPENNVTIYTIAMGTDDDPTEDARGKAALSACASGPSFYKETSGDELVAIFEAIAEQITDLRLTQ
ncbi:VWA domain-containing protein [Yoonia sp. R2331]|uniref:vWA domain-containing protein n=1 Tax=Yoonia sp. R2331 TaxID=3237238 RepID=UPI0034E44DD7